MGTASYPTQSSYTVHSTIDKYGIKHEYSDIFGKAGLKWLGGSIELKPVDRLMIDNYLTHIQSINRQISRVDEEVTRIAVEDEYVRLLMRRYAKSYRSLDPMLAVGLGSDHDYPE